MMLLKNIILYILSCMVESTCMLPLENAGIIVLVYVEGTLYQVEFILHK